MTDFFQSERWWQFQEALGHRVLRGEGVGWHYFGRLESDKVGPYLYLPYGPVAEGSHALSQALAHAKQAAKTAGCYRVVCEPAYPITAEQVALTGAKRLEKTEQPSRTLVVDLTQSEEEIIKQMNTTRRKQWRGAAKRGFEFSKCQSDADFWLGVKLLRERGETKSFGVKDDAYFAEFHRLYREGVAEVFVAKHEGETKLVGYAVDSGDTRYYLYVGRDTSNLSLTISGPFVTYLILQAKEKGLKTFDFFGISASDEVPDEYTGFTVFKRTFGGQTVQYAGGWELPVNYPRYLVRTGIQRGKRLKAKAAGLSARIRQPKTAEADD